MDVTKVPAEMTTGLSHTDHTHTAAEIGAAASSHTHSAESLQFTNNALAVTLTEKNTWNAKQSALGFTPENVANKNISGGYAGLDSNGKLLESVLPSLSITDTFFATSDSTMIALSSAQKGDVCIRTDTNKTYILSTNNYSTLSDWKELKSPTAAVASVNGYVGAVVLSKADLTLGNVDNTSDLNKPISTTTQTALNGKVDTTRTINNKSLINDITLSTTDISDSTNKRYVTDAQITLLGNTSGINSGNETLSSISSLMYTANIKSTLADADTVPLIDSANGNSFKRITWLSLKANIQSLTDTLYNYYTHPANHSPSIILQDSNNRFVTDIQISTWDAKQSALGFTPENSTNKNIANGYAGLDSNGKVVESLLPSLVIVDTFTATSDATMIALSNARKGDICIRTDINKTYILSVDGYSTLSNWLELRTPTDVVQSVNGKMGIITLTTADISDSTDKRYVTDSQLTLLGNTSGVNSGDETATTLGTTINSATNKATPVDADVVGIVDSVTSNILKKITWSNVKYALKTYFDTLYNLYIHPNHTGDVTSVADGVTTIASGVVTNVKLATVATGTIKGRTTTGTGAVEDLTASQARSVIGVYSTTEIDAQLGNISSALTAILG